MSDPEGDWPLVIDATGTVEADESVPARPREVEPVDVELAHDQMVRLWSELEDLEAAESVSLTAYPDPGLAWPVHETGSLAAIRTGWPPVAGTTYTSACAVL